MDSSGALIGVIFWLVVFGIPCWKLLQRCGKSYAWLLLFLFPLFGLIVVLWVVAFSKWHTRDVPDYIEPQKNLFT